MGGHAATDDAMAAIVMDVMCAAAKPTVREIETAGRTKSASPEPGASAGGSAYMRSHAAKSASVA